MFTSLKLFHIRNQLIILNILSNYFISINYLISYQKFSPVKYKSFRFNKFINSTLFEIEIIPTMDSEINLTDYKKIFENQ